MIDESLSAFPSLDRLSSHKKICVLILSESRWSTLTGCTANGSRCFRGPLNFPCVVCVCPQSSPWCGSAFLARWMLWVEVGTRMLCACSSNKQEACCTHRLSHQQCLGKVFGEGKCRQCVKEPSGNNLLQGA